MTSSKETKVGALIRAYRYHDTQNILQIKDFAFVSGIAYQTLSAIERGVIRIPKRHIYDIVTMLKIPHNEFMNAYLEDVRIETLRILEGDVHEVND